MVNLTQTLFKYYPKWMPKPQASNGFLRKQALYKLTFAQPGRARNCYRLATRCFIRHLQIDQEQSKQRAMFMRDLNSQRIYAACEDLGYPYKNFIGKLPRVISIKSIKTSHIY